MAPLRPRMPAASLSGEGEGDIDDHSDPGCPVNFSGAFRGLIHVRLLFAPGGVVPGCRLSLHFPLHDRMSSRIISVRWKDFRTYCLPIVLYSGEYLPIKWFRALRLSSAVSPVRPGSRAGCFLEGRKPCGQHLRFADDAESDAVAFPEAVQLYVLPGHSGCRSRRLCPRHS